MKIFWKWFLSCTKGTQIALFVSAVHCLLLCYLMGHYFFISTRKTLPPQRMSIRTVTSISPPGINVKPQIKSAKTQKKSPPKNLKATQTSKKLSKEENLLHTISKSLDSLTTESKQKKELSIPILIQNPEEFSSLPSEELIAFLQNALTLPEFGEVVAKIEISPLGEFVSCEILETRSKKNGEFLKNRLHELRFPCFNHRETTFTVTFRNVENL